MAIEVRHKCTDDEDDFLTVHTIDGSEVVFLNGMCYGQKLHFTFDISTAIRLSKSIRTEINKAKKQ